MSTTTTHQLRQDIAGEIRAEMGRRRITQAALAFGLGWNKSSTSRKLNGETPLDIDEIEDVCAFLEVSVVDLLTRLDDGPRTPGGTVSSRVDRPVLLAA